ncbi:unnamed protein product [Phytophthora lilii]|uniref:Unnamed protein product n=1 Tax=Phytophthora lilii TaxID=2077276 RepID=A0A9W6WPN0_9STRA|nr:unnamed protein product [Phytophthora lilii]
MAPPKTVLIVVNVLPLVFERDEASASGWRVAWATSATAMLYRTLVRDAEQYSPLFVGCPEVFVAKSEEAALEKQLLALRCVPVLLDPPVAHRYFQGFCNGVLWPVFHNVVDVYNSAELQLDCEEKKGRSAKAWFGAKKEDAGGAVKSAWCDPVSWNPAAQDMCWSDYCSVNRHFLTSCKRLLGLDYKTCPNGMLVMEYNGRKIHISCSHVEPDVTHLHEMLDQNEADSNGAALDFAAHVKNAIMAGRDQAQHRLVIGSVDRLEGLTAIPLKLRAFERFLATHPDKRNSVVLVQIGISLDSRPNDYHRTRDYVLKFTEEINRRYAPPGGVVVYFEEKRKTTCAERVILWRMCDVYLDTCVRGGLSLLPFEYIIAQHRNILSKSRNPTGWSSPRGNMDVGGLDRSFGIMIVSEFSAYSRILSGSLAVNPWKTDDMAAAFAKACTMSYYEKHNRFYMNYKFLVGKSDAVPWGERLLADVEAVTDKNQDSTSGEVVQVGFGFDFRVMRFESGFVSLDVDELVKKCTGTSRRLFILDYGGTLSSTASILDEEGAQYSHHGGFTDQVAQKIDIGDRYNGDCTVQSAARYIDGKVRKPVSDETRANLRTLCADPCNIVFITSNTQRAALEDQFGSIPNLHLIAENGLFIKKGGRSDWECLCDEEKRAFDWKDDAKRVMQAYAARTNGSFLIENAASLLYDYRNSDQEYGEIQSLELCAQLRHIVEVRSPDKLIVILKEQVGVPEFAFVVGDDDSDEKVFQGMVPFNAIDVQPHRLSYRSFCILAVHTFAENEPQLEHVMTCTVGKKPSCAKNYVVCSLCPTFTVPRSFESTKLCDDLLLQDNMPDILTALHVIGVRQPRTYSRQFLKLKRLVSKEFLQSLDRDMRSLSMLSSGSTTMTSGQDTEELFAPNPTAAPPINWSAIGAAVVAGCIIGAVAATQRQRLLRHLHRRDPVEKFSKPRYNQRRRRPRHRAGLLSLCSCFRALVTGPCSGLVVAIAGLLVLVGVACSTIALVGSYSADEYLFLGAIASAAFTLVIIVAFLMSPAVRAHPNPLIFSKSLVDLLLAMIYVAEYCVTEFSADSVVLPFRIAAITQALLIAGEFWFFAIPIDMVQSITNPFTSYAHNFRVYWFYSVLSGIVCGLVLWSLGDAEAECLTMDDTNPDCVKAADDNEQRFIWFHHNTDMPGFFWHQWILYHVCVVVYLLFGVACMVYVRSRLRRGLEETFEVRRRVLSNGMLTCAVFISWSFLMICLFAMTNTATVKSLLGKILFKELIDLSAFLHASRGCVNIIVWIVVNAPYFPSFYAEPADSTLQSPSYGNGLTARGSFSPGGDSSGCTETSDIARDDSHKHEEKLMNPQLNVALRKQMIHMATNGIIESIQHHHRMRRENGNNHTFQLDWQRSPQRRIRQLVSSSSFNDAVGSMTIPPRSMPILREMRSSTVRVVEEPRDNPSNMRFTFMPMALTEMQFYDFQPRVFASIRQLYGVNDAEYIFAFRSTINERISEGRSGAFVFNTCDRKYLVKSTTSKEKDVLLRLLPSYLRYLKWNPGTLLPRFFGFHAMKMYGQIFYFIVMGNVLSTTEVIHRRYDIKGSWEDRNAPACVLGEKYRCSKCNRFFTFGGAPDEPCFLPGEEHYPDITLRDNDLKKRLKLEPETAVKLVKQLTRDSNYLASAGIMDYSLLIGTHYSHFTITTEYKRGISRRKSVELTAYCADTFGQKSDVEFLPTLNGNRRSTSEDDALSEGTRPSESSDFGGRLSDLSQGPGPSDPAVYPQSHSYHAHQVSGPSKYYFGLVDILQEWTVGKQIERAYKRKMKQLFITMPAHPLESLEDDAPNDIPAHQV